MRVGKQLLKQVFDMPHRAAPARVGWRWMALHSNAAADGPWDQLSDKKDMF
jgi:hypothetical protein